MTNKEEIVFRGAGPFPINRAELAKNMQATSLKAKDLGVRPGQLLGDQTPIPGDLSADGIAVTMTMMASKPK